MIFVFKINVVIIILFKLIKRFLLGISFLLLLVSYAFSQTMYNPNLTKYIIKERKYFFPDKKIDRDEYALKLSYNNYLYFNTNQPNLENYNGLYLSKGYGSISGLLIQYKGEHFTISTEPRITYFREYGTALQGKKNLFSVLNDTPLDKKYRIHIYGKNFRNTGLIFHFSSLSLGYGNWDQWWGPGIHNSLVLSNNALGMPQLFIETLGYQTVFKDFQYKFKYTVSDGMLNNVDAEYFLSAYYFNLRFSVIELGMSQHILSGGYYDLPWSLNDALGVLITHKNMKYWDEIIDYYISAEFPSSGLKVFLEFGFPKRSFYGQDIEVYQDHAMGSNLGLRKYGAFGRDQILFGFEYTRLVQGIYYNMLPTPNWYDNIKYNYSSYNGRRWAAHSGADSDDFFIFFGYMDEKMSFIYGLNYERHGVTYHFPPEVKFESRISASIKYKNTFINLNYENEYFEHYGFVDVNENVWEETFEPGSIQRAQTLLISIEHTISF